MASDGESYLEYALGYFPNTPKDCVDVLLEWLPKATGNSPPKLFAGEHWPYPPRWFYGIAFPITPDNPFITWAVKHNKLTLIDYWPAGKRVPGLSTPVCLHRTIVKVIKYGYRKLNIGAPEPQIVCVDHEVDYAVVANMFSNYSTRKETDPVCEEVVVELKKFFELDDDVQPMWYKKFN